LTLKKAGESQPKRVILEFNNEELETFVQNLYTLQNKLEQ